MANGVYIGMSGAVAAERRLDVVSNNIANGNTIGFRQQRVVFSEVLVETLDGRPSEKGFTAVADVALDTQAGAMTHTGNPLDVALEGDGYFVVQGASGPMLTRAGAFKVDSTGTLVDHTGLPVMGGTPEQGFSPIQASLDAGQLSVAGDGTVSQAGTALAQLSVVTTNGPGLSPTGGAHLVPAPGSLQAKAGARVAVGTLEESNVNPVRGMVELIEISNDYQTSQKMMNETRKLDRAVMSIVR